MNMEKKTRKIVINQGQEYKIRLGSVYEEDSLFTDSYRQGAKCLREILPIADVARKERREAFFPVTEDDDYYEFSNNMIVFCGDRGEGKSSALRTFAHALEELHREESRGRSEEEKFWGTPMDAYTFQVLPVIDPTMMGEQDSFMRIILSRMFSQFSQCVCMDSLPGENRRIPGKRHKEISSEYRAEILGAFRDCYTYLDTLNRKPDIGDRYDDLEEIASLSDSGNLKRKFRELVRAFLHAMCPDSDGTIPYLVLQIDDADLNIRQAYRVLEDIRTYCMVPEVLILMAVNMEQFQMILEQHSIEDFELMLQYSPREGETAESFLLGNCRKMAMRYVEKVLPGGRQIHLPHMNDLLKEKEAVLSVSYMGLQNPGTMSQEKIDLLAENRSISEDYQECLLGWLYRKTGIALIKPDGYRHNLLPEQLRELTHFLAYFGRLEDLNPEYNIARIHSLLRTSQEELFGQWKEKRAEAEKAKDLWEKNLEALEQYVLKNWIGLHLGREEQKKMQRLENTANTLKPQMICEFCEQLARKQGIDLALPDCAYVKYSYAFVMTKLNRLTSALKRKEDYEFVYALRFLCMLSVYKKLLAAAGDDTALEGLLQEGKFESWVTDYSGQKEGFSYRRFEVNLMALSKIRPEFSLGANRDNLCNRLRDMVYVVTPDKEGRAFQKEDIQRFMEGDSGTAENEGCVLFDWSYVVMRLSLVTGGKYSPNSADESVESWKNKVDWVDMAFQLLFNWDIQHYLEKRLTKEGTAGTDSWRVGTAGTARDFAEWFATYWANLLDILKEEKYIEWMVAPDVFENRGQPAFFDLLPAGFHVLLYGNYEVVQREFENVCDQLQEKLDCIKSLEKESLSEDAQENTKLWDLLYDTIRLLQMYAQNLESCLILTDALQAEGLTAEQLDQLARKSGKGKRVLSRKRREEMLDVCQRWLHVLKEHAGEQEIDRIFGGPESTKSGVADAGGGEIEKEAEQNGSQNPSDSEKRKDQGNRGKAVEKQKPKRRKSTVGEIS